MSQSGEDAIVIELLEMWGYKLMREKDFFLQDKCCLTSDGFCGEKWQGYLVLFLCDVLLIFSGMVTLVYM